MKPTKATAQTLHSIRRGKERYISDFSLVDLISIKDMIGGVNGFNAKTTIFVEKQSNRLKKWKIFYDGFWYCVVYDSKRGTIATLLPEGTF